MLHRSATDSSTRTFSLPAIDTDNDDRARAALFLEALQEREDVAMSEPGASREAGEPVGQCIEPEDEAGVRAQPRGQRHVPERPHHEPRRGAQEDSLADRGPSRLTRLPSVRAGLEHGTCEEARREEQGGDHARERLTRGPLAGEVQTRHHQGGGEQVPGSAMQGRAHATGLQCRAS